MCNSHRPCNVSTGDSFALGVRDDAPLGSYGVRLTANYGGTPQHSVEITVNVIAPSSGGDPTRFVIVQGFAKFRISYIDSNTVAAYAIGRIVKDPKEISQDRTPASCYGTSGLFRLYGKLWSGPFPPTN